MQGGGRNFDEETALKVAGGVLAEDLLKKISGTTILAYVSQVHEVVLPESLVDHETLTFDQINGSTIRCPNQEYEEKMIAAIDAVRVRGDFIGGTITCIVRNFPWSRGSLAFNEIKSELAKGVMSLIATEGFEIGRGFTGEYMDESGQSGGIQGGISNPEIIKMRIAFEPKTPISRRKNTVSGDKQEARGDHHICLVPGFVPVVEAIVARVLLLNLIPECASWLMSRTNAVLDKHLQSPESAEAQIPLE